MLPVQLCPTSRGPRSKRRAGKCLCSTVLLVVFCATALRAQTTNGRPAAQQPSTRKTDTEKAEQQLGKNLFTLLNMAGTKTAADFTPLNQHERNRLFFASLINPLSFVRVGFSAGLDQWNDKPRDWEQGASGYGKRYGNILGQYTIQRTVSFGLSSALGEDNRYFVSGKKGFWRRTWYAVTSAFLARHRDGHLSFSFSQIGGVAAGAFLARPWLPPDQNSAGDGAVSFGITMASNAGTNVLKEFLPDILSVFIKKPKTEEQHSPLR